MDEWLFKRAHHVLVIAGLWDCGIGFVVSRQSWFSLAGVAFASFGVLLIDVCNFFLHSQGRLEAWL
jgi:hypothetical protein